MSELVLGLLHTGAMHPPVFDALVAGRLAGDDRLRGAQRVHVCDAWLLDEVIADGVTPLVVERINEHVETLARRGAAAVLITCSSIGEAVDQIAATSSVPVVRVDTAMARAATAEARRRGCGITVLATLTSTLGPTTRLVEHAAAGAVAVRSRVIEDAVARRDSGDQEGHDRLIREAVDAELTDASVVVLAQATMAAALPAGAGEARVFSSPESAVSGLIEAARATL